jgi:hypothetical protein
VPRDTPNYGFTVPTDEDDPDGPAQVGGLGDELDVVQWVSRSLKATSGVAMGSVAALTELQDFYTDTGAQAEVVAAVPSRLLAVTTTLFECSNGGGAASSLKVGNGEEQAKIAQLANSGAGGIVRATAVQVYSIALAAGTHKIKLRVKRLGVVAGNYSPIDSGFAYLLLAA